MADARIELKNVCKYYRTARGVVSALRDLSLGVAAGEFVAVQGPSGCGKSTLLLTIGGLLSPDEGRVEVAGVNPYALAPDERARFRAGAIGFVFQQFHLVPYLTVRDNILAPSGALSRTGAPDRAEALIRRFNLTERAGHRPAELSTGERQRTALARALLNEPRLLLADEPTGNLDRDNAATVMEAFVEFAQSGGTVLLVTHDDKIAGAADRVMRIKEGMLAP
ncbi:MAG: ABC transporter ATP-binding protein [Candidatus Latescibacterota bacterium]